MLTPSSAAGLNRRSEVILAPGQPVDLSWSFDSVPDQVRIEDEATGRTLLTLDPQGESKGSTRIDQVSRRQTLLVKAIKSGLADPSQTREITLAVRGVDLMAGDAAHPRKAYLNGDLQRTAGWRHVTGFGVEAGCLLFSEGADHTIRRADADGVVAAFAGTRGRRDPGTDDRLASLLNAPGPMAALDGRIYVVDTGTSCIKVIPADLSAPPAVFAGDPLKAGLPFADGVGRDAGFSQPCDIAADRRSHQLFVVDRGSRSIRRIDPAAAVTTLDLGRFAFHDPAGIAVDGKGVLYVADAGARCVYALVPADGQAQAYTAHAIAGVNNLFVHPTGLALSEDGKWLYVADTGRNLIEQIALDSRDRTVTTLAGDAQTGAGFSDGPALRATFDRPTRLAVVGQRVYVADQDSTAIRLLQNDGKGVKVTTLGCNGALDSAGALDSHLARDARFFHPMGVAVDRTGAVYVADNANHAVRLVKPNGEVVTVAGTLGVPHTTGQLDPGRLLEPSDLGLDGLGRTFILERSLKLVRIFDDKGVMSAERIETRAKRAKLSIGCLAVNPWSTSAEPAYFTTEPHPEVKRAWVISKHVSPGAAPQIVGLSRASITALAVDRDDNVFSVERNPKSQNCTIRRFAAQGQGHWAEQAPISFGPGTSYGHDAGYPNITAMATDDKGQLFLADAANGVVWGAGRDLASVAPVAGRYPDLAPVASARGLDQPLYQLHGIAVTRAGDLVLSSGNSIIQITAPGFVPAPAVVQVPAPDLGNIPQAPDLGNVPAAPPMGDDGIPAPPPMGDDGIPAPPPMGDQGASSGPNATPAWMRKLSKGKKRAGGNSHPAPGGKVDIGAEILKKTKGRKTMTKEELAKAEEDMKNRKAASGVRDSKADLNAAILQRAAGRKAKTKEELAKEDEERARKKRESTSGAQSNDLNSVLGAALKHRRGNFKDTLPRPKKPSDAADDDDPAWDEPSVPSSSSSASNAPANSAAPGSAPIGPGALKPRPRSTTTAGAPSSSSQPAQPIGPGMLKSRPASRSTSSNPAPPSTPSQPPGPGTLKRKQNTAPQSTSDKADTKRGQSQ